MRGRKGELKESGREQPGGVQFSYFPREFLSVGAQGNNRRGTGERKTREGGRERVLLFSGVREGLKDTGRGRKGCSERRSRRANSVRPLETPAPIGQGGSQGSNG